MKYGEIFYPLYIKNENERKMFKTCTTFFGYNIKEQIIRHFYLSYWC